LIPPQGTRDGGCCNTKVVELDEVAQLCAAAFFDDVHMHDATSSVVTQEYFWNIFT
jgi:hypothetical protein